jgi:hypothetical protein
LVYPAAGFDRQLDKGGAAMDASNEAAHYGEAAKLSLLSRGVGLPLAIALACGGAPAHAGPALTGFALLNANTFAEGPTSGIAYQQTSADGVRAKIPPVAGKPS